MLGLVFCPLESPTTVAERRLKGDLRSPEVTLLHRLCGGAQRT